MYFLLNYYFAYHFPESDAVQGIYLRFIMNYIIGIHKKCNKASALIIRVSGVGDFVRINPILYSCKCCKMTIVCVCEEI